MPKETEDICCNIWNASHIFSHLITVLLITIGLSEVCLLQQCLPISGSNCLCLPISVSNWLFIVYFTNSAYPPQLEGERYLVLKIMQYIRLSSFQPRSRVGQINDNCYRNNINWSWAKSAIIYVQISFRKKYAYHISSEFPTLCQSLIG